MGTVEDVEGQVMELLGRLCANLLMVLLGTAAATGVVVLISAIACWIEKK